jgi:hypothetical protein
MQVYELVEVRHKDGDVVLIRDTPERRAEFAARGYFPAGEEPQEQPAEETAPAKPKRRTRKAD